MCEVMDQAEKRGEQRGIEIGEQRGEQRGERRALYRLVQKELLTMEQAIEKSGMEPGDFQKEYVEYLKG